MYSSYFSQKTGFEISCKLSPEETIRIKCQSLFSGKNEKYHQFAELGQRHVKVIFWECCVRKVKSIHSLDIPDFKAE